MKMQCLKSSINYQRSCMLLDARKHTNGRSYQSARVRKSRKITSPVHWQKLNLLSTPLLNSPLSS